MVQKNLRAILIISVCLTGLLPVSGSSDISYIKEIRREYTLIEKAKFQTLVYIKDSKKKWVWEGDDITDEESARHLEARLYFDKAGRLRKFTYSKEEVGSSYRKAEYFLSNGKLFFLYAKEVQGGSGDWWDVRLYFRDGKVIENISDRSFHDKTGRVHRVKKSKYKKPGNHGLHTEAAAVIKEFDLNREKIKNSLIAVKKELTELHKTKAWLETKGKKYTVNRLRHLTRLDLGSRDVDDDELKYLKVLKKLQRLNLRGSFVNRDGSALIKKKVRISDKGLSYLTSLRNLKDLNLNDTKITNRGLAFLKGMTKLEKLDLSNTGISDHGLKYLRGLKRLKILTLYGTKVTNTGLMKLKQFLPGCEIHLLGA
jgi:hypothetical protein